MVSPNSLTDGLLRVIEWQSNTWKKTFQKAMDKLEMTWREIKKAQDCVVWLGIAGSLRSSRNWRQKRDSSTPQRTCMPRSFIVFYSTAMSCNVYGSVLYSSTCQQLQMTTTVTLCVDIWAWHKSTWSASAQLHCSAVTKIWPSKIQLRSNMWNPGQCYRNSGRHSISVHLKL